MPVVSIIIPCYNAEAYVAEAIQSALDQTYPNCEVIVIDDGSTDGSLKVIQSFGTRIRWHTGPNRGGCVARNLGLEMAQGEWIQFHDADDIMVRTCIEDKIGTPCNENEIVCGDAALITHPEIHAWGGESGYTLNYALRRAGPPTVGPLHRRSMLTAIGGFREGLPCAQDYDLALRLIIHHKVSFRSNNKIGTLVRPVANSVNRSAGIKLPLTVLRVLDNAIAELEKSSPLEPEQRLAVSEHFARIARTLWRLGSCQAALDAFDKSRRYSKFGYLRAYRNNAVRLLALVLGFRNFESLHTLASKRKEL